VAGGTLLVLSLERLPRRREAPAPDGESEGRAGT
jgi:hypothetical protein